MRCLHRELTCAHKAALSWGWEVARRAVGAPAVSQGSTEALRRISEMKQASAHVLAAKTASVPASAAAGQPALDLSALRSSSTGCASIAPTEDPSSHSNSHWRDILERVNAEPQSSMLTDSYGRFHTYLRISLTEKCNLRCQYCMPAEGIDLKPQEQLLSAQEITRLARIFVAEGIDKVRLTGGEPTLRKDLEDITKELGALPGLRTIAMTTNGIALRRKLPALRAAGMSALNISLDSLREDRFQELTRRKGAERVIESIHASLQAGFFVKINVVVMRGVNDDEILDFVALTKELPVNVRFIEYMPFDDNAWSRNKMYTFREMKEDIQRSVGQLQRCNDARGEVAKNFFLPGHTGTVSFITSMTEHFCSDCNRLRLLADGNLKVCLFGANEVSLRDAMREGATDEQLRSIISAAVKRKKFAHADMDILAVSKNRTMIQIGG